MVSDARPSGRWLRFLAGLYPTVAMSLGRSDQHRWLIHYHQTRFPPAASKAALRATSLIDAQCAGLRRTRSSSNLIASSCVRRKIPLLPSTTQDLVVHPLDECFCVLGSQVNITTDDVALPSTDRFELLFGRAETSQVGCR